MNIKILVNGKIKEKFAKEAIKEYAKRLSRYCKIKMIEVKSEQALLKNVTDKTHLIAIDTDGEKVSSEELSHMIGDLGLRGKSDVTFLIGENGVLDGRIDKKVAISSMDMDLDIQGMIIYEQVYRAYRILNNEPYHK